MQWSIADIADAVAEGLRRRAKALEREQAVCGLDGLDEVSLHPIIARALEAADYGVHREQRYPTDRRHRRLAEGKRCDLVLTPGGRGLEAEDERATLFDAPDPVDLDQAFWLEVKTLAQFHGEGPNHGYASNLLSTVGEDVTKLSRDRGIIHAGLLIVLFVEAALVAEHDLGVWQDRCLERGLPIGAPSRRELAIGDRLGNRVCAMAVYPVGRY